MGFLDYILGFSAETPSLFPHDPNDERAWRPSSGYRDTWGGFSGPASTGTYVRSDDAIGVSCVFLGVRIYANLLGTNPIRFYRNRPRDEGEDQIYDHPLFRVLSPDGQANPWQHGALWRMWTEAQALLWGVGLSEIKFGESGLELWPIEAEHIPMIEQLSSGKKRFTICEPGKVTRHLTQDQVFQLEGFGTHKLIPESLLRRSREAVAVWLAQQQYRGTYFERGASPSIIFQHPGTISDGALKRFKDGVQGRVGGNRNAHKTLVIEEAMTVKEFGHTARNAQLVEAWDSQAVEIARWMGLPPYMFGVSKQPPYASREQATREFLDMHLRPKAVLWESAIKRDLIGEPGVVCEIDLDQLKRGDALTQAQTDAIYIMNGVKLEVETRRELGLNPIPGMPTVPSRSVNQDRGGGDRGGDPRQPRPDNPGDRETRAGADVVGMLDGLVPGFTAEQMRAAAAARRGEEVGGGPEPLDDSSAYTTDGIRTRVLPPLAESTTPAAARHRRVIESTARHLLTRETEAIRRRGVQLASDPTAWSLWLAEFYRTHRDLMAERLAIEPGAAGAYTEQHRTEVKQGGIGVCDEWEKEGRAIREMVGL